MKFRTAILDQKVEKMTKMAYKIIGRCNVCKSDNLSSIFSSKNMPLTGLYIPESVTEIPPTFDQSLNYCLDCGHGQLMNVINPEVLYDDTYTHRSSVSPISTTGNDFFLNYMNKTFGNKTFDSILEIGCNDLYLIKKIQEFGNSIVGIDPIWIGKNHQYNEKTDVKGCYVEDLGTKVRFDKKPDLVLSAHTFEHVGNIGESFENLVSLAADECDFLIEVPCLDTLVKLNRFDQVFHQHIQYLSLSSMQALIKRLNCEYIGHTFNYSYWGGTILFAFKKTGTVSVKNKTNIAPMKAEALRRSFDNFKSRLDGIANIIEGFDEPFYGFGAAQMLPLLAHHMGNDLSFLEGIIDDNPDRVGTRLPSVNCPIIRADKINNFQDIGVVITALDSARPILRRLLDLSPRRLINPAEVC